MKHLFSSSGFKSELIPTFVSNCVNPGTPIDDSCDRLLLLSMGSPYLVAVVVLLLLLLLCETSMGPGSVLLTCGSDRGRSSWGEMFSRLLQKQSRFKLITVQLGVGSEEGERVCLPAAAHILLMPSLVAV